MISLKGCAALAVLIASLMLPATAYAQFGGGGGFTTGMIVGAASSGGDDRRRRGRGCQKVALQVSYALEYNIWIRETRPWGITWDDRDLIIALRRC